MIKEDQFEQIIKALLQKNSIEKNIRKRKKDSKENFNFFNALVTDKQIHIEKYHTNFIAYLLDPNNSHDCDDLFLKQFLQVIQKKDHQNNSHLSLKDATVTINKKTIEGRFIDIVIEHKNEWILFIENKVRSYESENQLQDYYNSCYEETGKEPIGIFLTKTGYNATSIDDSKKIIPLSYVQIIEWLEECINELSEKHNIIHSIKQYTLALKQILNIMDNEAMKKFETYLAKEFVTVPTLEDIETFKMAVIKYSYEHEKRKAFYEHVVKILNDDFLKGTKTEDVIISRIDGNLYKIKVNSSNSDNSDGGYGGWFGVYNENDNLQKWEAVIIEEIDDFHDVIGGTNKIIQLKEDYYKTVKNVSDYIQNRIIEIISP